MLSEGTLSIFATLNPPQRLLTVKLRGRAEAPDGAEGAQFLSARGAKPQAHHGPLERLLDGRPGITASFGTKSGNTNTNIGQKITKKITNAMPKVRPHVKEGKRSPS
jgi:hypothetical protein